MKLCTKSEYHLGMLLKKNNVTVLLKNMDFNIFFSRALGKASKAHLNGLLDVYETLHSCSALLAEVHE